MTELEELRAQVDACVVDPNYTVVMCHDWIARFAGLPERTWTYTDGEIQWDDTPENKAIEEQIVAAQEAGKFE